MPKPRTGTNLFSKPLFINKRIMSSKPAQDPKTTKPTDDKPADKADVGAADAKTKDDNKDGQTKDMFVIKDGDSKIETNWKEVCTSFDDMPLKDDLLRGIYAYGFEKPSAIQQRGIIPILKGKDTIAQAQSGTGKTATFSISVLQQIELKLNKTHALILAPTRELAQQIQKVVRDLGEFLKITSHACVGGTLVRDDIRILRD